MSQKGKIESGAELLARLGPRPSLHGLEMSKVLGFEPSPGDIMELYGSEGVGKTELLLHLVCHAISPAHHCHGNKVEVVWVDTDLKFSVLRMAVLLEQRLMKRLNSQSQRGGDSIMSSGKKDETGEKKCGTGEKKCGTDEKKCGTGEKKCGTDEKKCGIGEPGKQRWGMAVSFKRQNDALETLDSASPSTSLHEPDAADSKLCGEKSWSTCSTLKRKAKDMEGDGIDSHSGINDDISKGQDLCCRITIKDKSLTNSAHARDKVSLTERVKGQLLDVRESDRQEQSVEEVERRVEECLQRVHVLRCTSSQNLICTLHSVQSLIAANRNIAVLVIDPVSAFFWSDKCSDFQQSSSFLHKNMSHIVSVLKKIASAYGVLVMVTKQALVKSQRKEQAGSIISPAKGLTGDAGEDNHVEFLGKAWSGAVTRRLVCSKSVCWQRGVRMTHYTLTSSASQTQFTIDDSGIHVRSLI